MRMALNPFSPFDHSYGPQLKPYRTQRILYPFLAWLLALGNQEYILLSMILVNIIAFVLCNYFFYQICQMYSVNKKYCIFIMLLSACYMTAARNLSDLLALCFFLGALYSFCQRKFIFFTLYSLLSMLSRESSLIVIFLFFSSSLN